MGNNFTIEQLSELLFKEGLESCKIKLYNYIDEKFVNDIDYFSFFEQEFKITNLSNYEFFIINTNDFFREYLTKIDNHLNIKMTSLFPIIEYKLMRNKKIEKELYNE